MENLMENLERKTSAPFFLVATAEDCRGRLSDAT